MKKLALIVFTVLMSFTSFANPTAPPFGDAVFFEIPVEDFAKAEAFYGGLLGWTFQELQPDFRFIINAGRPIGGLVKSQKVANRTAAILTFFHVDDTQISAAKAISLGASEEVKPTTIPGTGSYAVLRDPDGNQFALFSMKEIP